MLVTNLRRIALVAALVASTMLPHTAAAQSSAPDSVDQNTPAAVGALAETPSPMYLRRLAGVRSHWTDLEYYVGVWASDRRSGTFNQNAVPEALRQYGISIERADADFAELTPPTELAHVHQLHAAASNEFDAAMGAAIWWLQSGDQGGLRDSQAHFALMDRLLGQALLEIG